MATRQSTVRLPERSWQQVNELNAIFGDNTKVFAVAIDRLHQAEIARRGKPMNTRTIEKWDRVLIDGEPGGTVIQDGATQSLVSHRRSDGEPGEQHDWYDNQRLTIIERRREKALGDEPPDVKLY